MSTIVTARELALTLSNGRELFRALNLTLDDGVTALVGPNGVGKTSLARIIAGEPTRRPSTASMTPCRRRAMRSPPRT